MNSIFRSIAPKVVVFDHSGKRALSTTNKLYAFWEKDDRSGYDYKPLPDFKTRMRVGLSEMRNEIKLWCQEWKEKLDTDAITMFRPGETDVAWRFRNEQLDNWIVTADSDHNEGYSHCSLVKNNQGNAVFSGNINLRVPKDGQIVRAGYCSMKTKRFRRSFKREACLDWHAYNTLVLKVRGDGRSYMINLGTRGFYDVAWFDVYHFALFTRGGPYWQIAKIPFSKFFLATKGRVQDEQYPIPLEHISGFGLSVQDRHGGDFCLEIDYVGLEYDPKHVEEFAYEQYRLPVGLANV